MQILSVATGAHIGIGGTYFRRPLFIPPILSSSKRPRSTNTQQYHWIPTNTMGSKQPKKNNKQTKPQTYIEGYAQLKLKCLCRMKGNSLTETPIVFGRHSTTDNRASFRCCLLVLSITVNTTAQCYFRVAKMRLHTYSTQTHI